MALECLWAPWRMEFIQGIGDSNGCFLCRAAAAPRADDKANLVVRRGTSCLVMLNRYPYNNGHLLIAPCRHEGALEKLTPEELCEIMSLTVQAKRVLDAAIRPHGHNVGMNLGRVAGAGLEEHAHMHVIPRWSGDTNFVTTVASTKVIPQALAEMWEILSAEWEKTAGAD